MIVRISRGAGARLLEADDFGAFKVATDIPPEERAALATAAQEVGRLDGDGRHLWVSRAWLMEAGTTAAGPNWRQGAEKMLAYAESKGWTEPATGAVRAHLEN